MRFEFDGIPSGDYEAFCWDVDYDTYVRIKTEVYRMCGRSEEYIQKAIVESSEFDESCFNEGLYRIYPNDVIDRGDRRKQHVIIDTTFY